jgi:hypothetical protein
MGVAVRWFALVFALVLGATGAGALLAPDSGSLSTAGAYAWFHLGGALAGLAAFGWSRGAAAPAFLLVFGALDLYQAAASALGWFPVEAFRWKPADDLAHLILGPLLVGAGAVGLGVRRRP